MDEKKYQIGMIGLGVMGRNLVLNIAEHGYSVAGYDKDESQVKALQKDAGELNIKASPRLDEFVACLSSPRVIMLLVPAGKIVDSVIRDLMPFLNTGDQIIDAGNSHFKDTDLRSKSLAEKRILFMGIGISGGEEGARRGPSLMPGGPKEAYERVKAIFEAVAAHVDGVPCVTYLGPGSAGHYVKMVHNGIEYGLMQLIAESYDLLKRGVGLTDDELSALYHDWNSSELSSYLMEITSNIFRKIDVQTGKQLVDVILDVAKQKGTGMWTSQDAMDLSVPTPVVDAAVAMRNLSALKSDREALGKLYKLRTLQFKGDRNKFISQLKGAIYTAMIITFAQEMAQLQAASKAYAYELDLEDVARIWRGGCIIRASLLEDIGTAYRLHPNLANLLMDRRLRKLVKKNQKDLRLIVRVGAKLGLPVPALMASLAYFDGCRSAWLPANLIQAQRDDFGAHMYERVDARGEFHTNWEQV
jgi:6-phosphogluconate dehydrogenase